MKTYSKLLLLSLLMTYNWNQSFAQLLSTSPKVTFSTNQEFGKKETQKVIGKTVNNITIVLRIHDQFQEGIIIDLFNNNLLLIKSLEIDLNYTKDKTTKAFHSQMLQGNILSIFSSSYNASIHTNNLLVQKIDLTSEVAVLTDEKIVYSHEIDTKKNEFLGFTNFIANDNGEILVIPQQFYLNLTNRAVKIAVYDSSLSELYNLNIKSPYNFKDFSPKNIIFDNSSNIHFLGLKILSKEESKNKSIGYDFILKSYIQKQQEFIELNFNLEGYEIKDLVIDISNNIVSCVGIYVENENIVGFFSKKFNLLQQNELYSSKSNSASLKLKEVKVKDFIQRTDDGAYIVCEEYDSHIKSYSNITTGTIKSVDIHNYNDFLVVNIDPDGEILWTKRIAKVQTSGSFGKDTFYPQLVDNNLFLLYNLSKGDKNDVSFDKKVWGVLNYVYLNMEGFVSNGLLYKYPTAEKFALWENAYSLDQSPTVTILKDKKNYQLMKIDLKY